MKCGEGWLTAFGLGFAPHLQRHACTALALRAYPVDLFWPLARAPVAPLHRLRWRGQQLVIKTRQGLVQRGGKAVFQRGTAGGAPLDTPAPLRPFVAAGLGPTAPIAYRVPRLQDRPPRLELGSPTADAPPGLPGGCGAVTRDAQMA
jgi:hypothetical protein